MSISSEIQRLAANVGAAKTAIAAKGVTVPASAKSDDLAALIGMIHYVPDDLLVLHVSWDGTTGTSDYGYDDIALALAGTGAELGVFTLGTDVLSPYGSPYYVIVIATIQNGSSVYGTSVYVGGLVSMDDTNKKAWFQISETQRVWVDENSAAGLTTISVS